MEVLAQLAAQRKSRVLTLVHRRDAWEADGSEKSIGIEDTELVLMELRRTAAGTPIDLIVHTPGGLVLAAEMIAMALKRHGSPVTVMVPFYSMSGGTLVALAADHILMEPFSVLGPLDPQVGGVPAPALVRLMQSKTPQFIDDHSLILAQIAESALEQMRGFIRWLLDGKIETQRASQVAEFLTSGYLTHSSPITIETAQLLGLPVTSGIPDLVYDFFDTCSHGRCLRPGLAPLVGPVSASPK